MMRDDTDPMPGTFTLALLSMLRVLENITKNCTRQSAEEFGKARVRLTL